METFHYVDDIESDSKRTAPSPVLPPVIDLSQVIATTIFNDPSRDSSFTDDLADLTDVFDPSKESTDFEDSGLSQDQVVLCGDKLNVRQRCALSSCEVLELDTDDTDVSMTTDSSHPMTSTPAGVRPVNRFTPNKNNSFTGDSRFNDSLTNLLGSPPPDSALYNNPHYLFL